MIKPFVYNAILDRVIDGDTIDVHLDLGFNVILEKQRVRLHGIDTPESRTRDLAEKKLGLAAKARLIELCGTKLKIDPYDIIFGKQILGTVGGDLQIDKNLQLFNKIVQSNPVMKKSFLKYQYNLSDINKAFNDLKKGKVLRPLIKL